ncbi:hypothetical protein H6801_04615 [Candidatus Nomurabacteria bacterium]|nr:hypothetical protein [Candidatus Nomurabacteria bacterium]
MDRLGLKIGGDKLNSGWTTNYEEVGSLTVMALYMLGLAVQLKTRSGWNGSTWTKIGGDGLNSSWTGA